MNWKRAFSGVFPLGLSLVGTFIFSIYENEIVKLWFFKVGITFNFFASIFNSTLFLFYLLRGKYLSPIRNFGVIVFIVFLCLILHSFISMIYGISGSDKDGNTITSHEFWDAFYFSIVTLVTLGYGDFSPSSDVKLVSAMFGLYGFVILGIIVAEISEVIRGSDEKFKPGSKYR